MHHLINFSTASIDLSQMVIGQALHIWLRHRHGQGQWWKHRHDKAMLRAWELCPQLSPGASGQWKNPWWNWKHLIISWKNTKYRNVHCYLCYLLNNRLLNMWT